ncbi:MAG TPA: MFS transporter [Solirubrobacteraceae bacterium]|nr:MFS transporter [Solirubrobacteraceae bacterium]
MFSLGAALAPSIEAFLALRALQGAANAFLTPLLLAGLAEVVDPARLGRSVGTFAAVQTAAVALSPLCGGLLGEIDWRLAFLLPAVVSLGLAFFAPAEATRDAAAAPARLRAVLTRRVGLLSAAAFAGYAGVAGLAFLIAIRVEDAFGLGSTARGVLLAGFGVAGMVLGRPSGRLVDRFGRVPVAVAGALSCAVLIAGIGEAGSAEVTAVLWLAAGAGSSLLWAGLNTLAIEAVPGNRAGATSVFSAFKFAGNAAAPLMWLPLYAIDASLSFAAAGALTAGVAALALALRTP